MDIFKKSTKKIQEPYKSIGPDEVFPQEDSYIWVDGYKHTDKDMRDYDGIQYELGKIFDAKNTDDGFYFCLNLADARNHQAGNLDGGNRFFKVKALVRERDYKYGNFTVLEYVDDCPTSCVHNVLVAKTIILLSELSVDEILQDTMISNLPYKYKKIAIDNNDEHALDEYQRDTLVYGWTSVDEGLPDIDPCGKGRYGGARSVRVLCACKQRDGKTFVKEGYCEPCGNGHVVWRIPGSIDSVTHWMPLPEPPKE